MSAEHTPTPWRVYISGGIVTAHDEYVPVFNAANESFIVRAVNAHDDLVATLKHALDLFEDIENCDAIWPPISDRTNDEIDHDNGRVEAICSRISSIRVRIAADLARAEGRS
jgi:hypothetical protein